MEEGDVVVTMDELKQLVVGLQNINQRLGPYSV